MQRNSRRTIFDHTPFQRYAFGVLLALEVLMSFTFLGYIHIPPISITLAYIPVVAAACLFGVGEATMMGAVFGLASMYKASANYVMASDKVFSPVHSPNPLGSILLSVGARALFGLAVGLLFALAKRTKHFTMWRVLLAFISPKLHGLLVIAVMELFFPEQGEAILHASSFKISDLLLAALSVLLVEILWQLVHTDRVQKLKDSIDRSDDNPYVRQEVSRCLRRFIVLLLGLSGIAAIYFAQRAAYMLGQHDIAVSAVIRSDLLHLQIQFVAATMSLIVLMAYLLLAVYRYMSYQEYLRSMDALTGVMGRRTFLSYCNKLLQESEDLETHGGWFLMLDVDRFKYFNDTFGHPTGDHVLRQLAQKLEQTFGKPGLGIVGRMGGDEFAVLIEKPMTEEELGWKLDEFQASLSDILPAPNKVTSSIGGCHFNCPQEVYALIAEADSCLYDAKRNGRAGHVLGEFSEEV